MEEKLRIKFYSNRTQFQKSITREDTDDNWFKFCKLKEEWDEQEMGNIANISWVKPSEDLV